MTPTIKASELVKFLQDAIEENGDLEVRLPFEGEGEPLDCAGVVALEGENGGDPFFMICHSALLDTLPVEQTILTH